MRILLVTLFFPPERNAGTENYTFGIARGLIECGHHVEVTCAGKWDEGAVYFSGVTEDVHDHVPVRRVNLNWTKARDPNLVLYESEIVETWFERLVLDLKPDLVHVTSAITLGIGVLRATRRRGIPLMLTLTDFWFLCPRTVLVRGDGELCDGRTTPWECKRCLMTSSNFFRRVDPLIPRLVEQKFWERLLRVRRLARLRGARGMALDMGHRRAATKQALHLADIIVSPSRFVARTFANSGLSSRVRYLPHGHDLTWLGRYRGKSRSHIVRFAYMGQLTFIKGVHLLVDAFRRAALGDRGRLDIWGDPTKDHAYMERLRVLAADSDGIAFRGPYNRDVLADVLMDVDVLVVPSEWYENAPLVIQEAFATKTPVIAANLGGMAEAVTHGVNGLLFERRDVDDLARQLRRVVDEPTLLADLAAGTPEVKTIDQEVTELESIYHELIGIRSEAGVAGGRLLRS